MRVGVLGPLEVDGGAPGLGPRDRTVLAALALRPGRAVRADTLAEALWGDAVPASSAKVVQGCVLRLRRLLGRHVVETVPRVGYRLVLHVDEVDASVFEDLVGRARDLLTAGEPDRARYAAERALELWRGDPFPDLEDWAPAVAGRERLVELNRDVEEVRAEAVLATGGHAEVLADLHSLVTEEPTREHRWVLLAVAEYRWGRQAEALETLRRGRRHLVDELGLDPGEEMCALEQAVLAHDPVLELPLQPVTSAGCPYPGLLFFDVDDAAAFHGREAEVAAAVLTLDRAGALVVVGPSGSGKSSLLRAGVAAVLRRDGTRVDVLTPGDHPVAALDAVDLRSGDVLVVDQLEEAFEAGADELDGFVSGLDRFVRSGGRLVLGVRGDRVGELAAHPALARLAETALHLLGPMSPDDLRRAVSGPAEQAGLRLEPGLVDLVVREVEGEPAALPLLSHVLRETWAVREGRTLTVAGYRSTGGVQAAVAKTAEDLFRDLDADGRSLLRQLMTRLVSTGEEGSPVRRRVPRRSVDQDLRRHELVERLIAARLVVSDGDEVEIAHESLTLAWPRLRSWLDDDVDGLRTMRHVAVAAESWDQLGRPDSELYRGVRESRAGEWRARVDPDLTEVERSFLDASAALARREKEAAEARAHRDRVTNRRLRVGLAAVVVLAAAAATAGVVAADSAGRASEAALVADARRLGSEALRAKDVDTSLLYAVAALRLDDSIDTRSALLGAIDKAPSLVSMTRSPRVTGLAMGRGGDVLLATSADAGLKVLDATTLEVLRTDPEIDGASVVASADASVAVATMSPSRSTNAGRSSLILLDDVGVPSDRELGGIPEGSFVYSELSMSPDGRHVAAFLRHAEDPPLIGVWDARAPEEPVALLPGDEWYAPLVDGTGRRVFVVGDRGLGVLDVATGRERRVLSPDDLRVPFVDPVLTLSRDGQVLAVAAGPQVLLLDASTLERRGQIVMDGPVGRLTFSPSGRLLTVSGDVTTVFDVTHEDDVVHVFEQETGRPNGWVPASAFSPDEATLYTSDFGGSVRAWDLSGSRGFLASRRSAGARIPEGSFGQVYVEGRYVIHCSAAPAFLVESLTDGATTDVVDPEMRMNGSLDCAMSPDGELATITTSDSRVAVWDNTGSLLVSRGLTGGEGASISRFTDDGALVVGTTKGRLLVLDARTLDDRRDPVEAADGERIYGLSLRPGGHEALLHVGEGVLVDLVTGEVRPSGVGTAVHSAQYSPDGTRLAVTGGDGSVGLWDVAGHRWISPPSDVQPFDAWAPAFSPDGTEFALAASGRVGRWDGRTGAFLGSVTVGEDALPDYSPDGRQLVLAAGDGRVYTWDLDVESWVAAACRMAGRDLSDDEWRAQLPDRERLPVCPRDPA